MTRTLGALAAVGIGALAVGIAAPAASADEFIVCPSGMTGVASEDTSCAFADNVRSALLTQPGTDRDRALDWHFAST